MTILLFPISFIGIYINLCFKKNNVLNNIFRTTIIWSLLSLILIELLSLFESLTKFYLIMLWGLIICVLIIIFVYNYFIQKKVFYFINFKKLKMTEKIFFILFIFIILLLLFIAIYTVPYNTDSLTYHLARVRMWIQNQTVSYYASWDARQVFYPPFSEYLVLQTYLLSSSDLFVNIISTFAYAISCISIYAIGKELLLKKSSIYFSLLLFMMCPIAISISLTTQVEMLIVMWVLLFTYYVIRIVKKNFLDISKEFVENVCFLSIVMGLGYITKSSIALIYFPFIIWIFITFIKKGTKIKLLLFYSFIVLIMVMFICFPHLWRYIQYTGELALYSGENALVTTLDIRYHIVNAYKNFCTTLFNKNGFLHIFFFDIGEMLSNLLGINYASPIITWGANLDHYYINNGIYSHDAGTSMILMSTFITLFIFRIKKLWSKKIILLMAF